MAARGDAGSGGGGRGLGEAQQQPQQRAGPTGSSAATGARGASHPRRAAATPQANGRALSQVAYSCARCRRSKTRCDGHMPCSRCFRLSLKCEPQRLRTPGAQQGEDACSEDDRDFFSQPVLDQVIQRVDPRAMAEVALQAFHEALREGRVDRARTLRTLRVWRVQSLLVGSDCSWGLIDELTRALGLSAVDLDGGAAGVEGPLHVRKARLRERMMEPAVLAARARLTQKLRTTEPFRRCDDRTTALCMTLMIDEPAPILVRATNEAWARLFRGEGEVATDVTERRTIQILLSAGMLAPEDRPNFFKDLVAAAFSVDPQPITSFCKIIDREGDIRLFIMRYLPVPEAELQGLLSDFPLLSAAHAQILLNTVEPVPPSRHINDRPGSHHSIVRAFRSVKPPFNGQLPPLPAPPSESSASVGAEEEEKREEEEREAAAAAAAAHRAWKVRKRPRSNSSPTGSSERSSDGDAGDPSLQLPPSLSCLPLPPLLDGGGGGNGGVHAGGQQQRARGLGLLRAILAGNGKEAAGPMAGAPAALLPSSSFSYPFPKGGGKNGMAAAEEEGEEDEEQEQEEKEVAARLKEKAGSVLLPPTAGMLARLGLPTTPGLMAVAEERRVREGERKDGGGGGGVSTSPQAEVRAQQALEQRERRRAKKLQKQQQQQQQQREEEERAQAAATMALAGAGAAAGNGPIPAPHAGQQPPPPPPQAWETGCGIRGSPSAADPVLGPVWAHHAIPPPAAPMQSPPQVPPPPPVFHPPWQQHFQPPSLLPPPPPSYQQQEQHKHTYNQQLMAAVASLYALQRPPTAADQQQQQRNAAATAAAGAAAAAIPFPALFPQQQPGSLPAPALPPPPFPHLIAPTPPHNEQQMQQQGADAAVVQTLLALNKAA